MGKLETTAVAYFQGVGYSWQLLLPGDMGGLVTTAVAYFQGVDFMNYQMCQVTRSPAVWWLPSQGLMPSPSGAASPWDCPECLATPVVR